MSEPGATSLAGRRVLVTGGAGVIGRELVARLTRQGAKVLCCDLEERPASFGADVQHVRGDANHLTLATLEAFAPERVFHLAATFERSVESPGFWGENFWHNVRLSHHLMTLLRRLPSVRRVVFASSYLIYDSARYSFDAPPTAPVRLDETTPIAPRNVCGAAKLLHETELGFLSGFPDAGFSTVSARIFRVYGRGSRDVISRWVRELVADPQARLALYRPEGLFDYVFAGDVAEGLLRLERSSATGVVNLGSGRARRVGEVVDVLRSHFPDLRTEDVPTDIPWEAHEANLVRLEDVTGWRPDTPLEVGIPALIDYERRRGVPTPHKAERPFGVLLTSASRKVDLVTRHQAALASLGIRGRVIAADLDGDCVAREFADGFWEMPPLGGLTTDALLAVCKEEGIRLLVPTRDGELPWLAERAADLAEAGVSVPLGLPCDVADCLDKWRFFERGRAAGLPVIATAASLGELPDARSYVAKERHGAGSRALGLDLDREQAVTHAAALRAPIFQPYVEGREHSVDLYTNRQGEVVEVVPRLRMRVQGGESVVSETVEAPDLVALAVSVARVFNLRGHAVLQAFVGTRGVQLIECNARYGGASALAFEAGLGSPRYSILEALGQRVAPHRGQYRRGLRLLRHAADRFVARRG